jgi:hypothetical protein
VIGWTNQDLLGRMRKGWRGGLADGTPCGSGSTMSATASIREKLPSLMASHGIQSVCDAGAGDQHWIGSIQWKVEYRAFDLVPRREGVTALDITRDALPSCDVVLCRHVLIHLDPARISMAISLFRQSAKYLLASQYDNAGPFDNSEQYNPTDLRPLLGEPLERVADTGSDLALWRL